MAHCNAKKTSAFGRLQLSEFDPFRTFARSCHNLLLGWVLGRCLPPGVARYQATTQGKEPPGFPSSFTGAVQAAHLERVRARRLASGWTEFFESPVD